MLSSVSKMPYVYDLGQRPWVGPVAGLALLLLLHHILRYYQYRRKRSANGCRPPPSYPHADGALGIGHFLTVVKAKKEKRLPDLFCSIFGDPNTHTIAHFMLGKKSYWTREPKNIKALLSSNFKDWGLPNARAKAFSRCWGGGIFGADGHQWEHSRAILRPSFNRTQIQDTDLLARHVANLICRIPDGEEIDLSELFPLFTMDIGIELMFGESTGCLDPAKSEEGKEFASCFNYIMRQMSVQLTIPMSASLPNTKLDQSVNFIYDYVDCFVNRALEVRGEHSDKSKLADEEKAEPSPKYCLLEELAKGDESPKQLRGELLSIMVAGRDTTASLLGILWWHLARRADVVQKLRDEIALLEGRSPSAKELKDMKYLERVLNEGKDPNRYVDVMKQANAPQFFVSILSTRSTRARPDAILFFPPEVAMMDSHLSILQRGKL